MAWLRGFIQAHFAVLCLSCLVTTSHAEEIVRLGVLAFRPAAEVQQRWQPLIEHLESQIPGYTFRCLALGYTELENAIRQNEIDFVLTNPGHYVLMTHRNHLSSPLATLVPNENGLEIRALGGVIFSRADRQDIRALTDVRGRIVAATSKASLGGYQAQAVELLKAGLSTPRDYSLLETGMPHDKVVDAVLEERAEAGFVRTDVLEHMAAEGRLDLKQIKVIGARQEAGFPFALSTRLYPEWPLAAMPHIEHELAWRVAQVLLAIPHASDLTRSMGIHGFVIPAEYESVREALRLLRLPPFDVQANPALGDIGFKFKTEITGALLAVVLITALLLWMGILNRRLKQERKRANLQVEKWHRLLNALGDGVYGVDGQGISTFVNPAALNMLGYTNAEVLGQDQHRLFHHQREDGLEYPVSACPINQTLIDGQARALEEWFIRKDGSGFPADLSVAPVDEASGQTGAVVVFRDISERKQAEHDLRQAKAYAENLIQSANVMIVELDCHGRVVRFNQTAETITGYTQADILGKDWFELLVPRGRYPTVWEKFEQIMATGGDAREFENPILTQSGEERFIVWRNSVISNHGQSTGTLSCGLDVTESRRQQERLAYSEALLREAQSIANIGHWSYESGAQVWSWSEGLFKILELDPGNTELGLAAFLSVVQPDDRARVEQEFQQFLEDHQDREIEFQLLMQNGRSKYVRQQFAAVPGQTGQTVRLYGILKDATLEILQEMGLKESEERFRTIANYTYDWEYWEGPDKELLFISPSCERVTGYAVSDFVRDPGLIETIVHPDDRARWIHHCNEIGEQRYCEVSMRIQHRMGETRWIAHGCQAVYSHDGTFLGRRSSNRDITELKQAEQLAHDLAHYDSLTRLPNRRMLLDRLQHALTQAKRFNRSMAVMFLDLDRFKQVNDSLGHDVGDQLLVAVAARLTECIREGDTVARTGGDEFIIVLPEIAESADASRVAEKIILTLANPIQLGEITLNSSTSIGIAVYPINGTDNAEELMKKADMAMYDAKQSGRNGYRLYESRIVS